MPSKGQVKETLKNAYEKMPSKEQVKETAKDYMPN